MRRLAQRYRIDRDFLILIQRQQRAQFGIQKPAQIHTAPAQRGAGQVQILRRVPGFPAGAGPGGRAPSMPKWQQQDNDRDGHGEQPE